jgi:hypothetical protein
MSIDGKPITFSVITRSILLPRRYRNTTAGNAVQLHSISDMSFPAPSFRHLLAPATIAPSRFTQRAVSNIRRCNVYMGSLDSRCYATMGVGLASFVAFGYRFRTPCETKRVTHAGINDITNTLFRPHWTLILCRHCRVNSGPHRLLRHSKADSASTVPHATCQSGSTATPLYARNM